MDLVEIVGADQQRLNGKTGFVMQKGTDGAPVWVCLVPYDGLQEPPHGMMLMDEKNLQLCQEYRTEHTHGDALGTSGLMTLAKHEAQKDGTVVEYNSEELAKNEMSAVEDVYCLLEPTQDRVWLSLWLQYLEASGTPMFSPDCENLGELQTYMQDKLRVQAETIPKVDTANDIVHLPLSLMQVVSFFMFAHACEQGRKITESITIEHLQLMLQYRMERLLSDLEVRDLHLWYYKWMEIFKEELGDGRERGTFATYSKGRMRLARSVIRGEGLKTGWSAERSRTPPQTVVISRAELVPIPGSVYTELFKSRDKSQRFNTSDMHQYAKKVHEQRRIDLNKARDGTEGDEAVAVQLSESAEVVMGEADSDTDTASTEPPVSGTRASNKRRAAPGKTSTRKKKSLTGVPSLQLKLKGHDAQHEKEVKSSLKAREKADDIARKTLKAHAKEFEKEVVTKCKESQEAEDKVKKENKKKLESARTKLSDAQEEYNKILGVISKAEQVNVAKQAKIKKDRDTKLAVKEAELDEQVSQNWNEHEKNELDSARAIGEMAWQDVLNATENNEVTIEQYATLDTKVLGTMLKEQMAAAADQPPEQNLQAFPLDMIMNESERSPEKLGASNAIEITVERNMSVDEVFQTTPMKAQQCFLSSALQQQDAQVEIDYVFPDDINGVMVRADEQGIVQLIPADDNSQHGIAVEYRWVQPNMSERQQTQATERALAFAKRISDDDAQAHAVKLKRDRRISVKSESGNACKLTGATRMTDFARAVMGVMKVVQEMKNVPIGAKTVASASKQGTRINEASQEFKTLLDGCANGNFLAWLAVKKLGLKIDTNTTAEVTGISDKPVVTEGEVEAFPYTVNTAENDLVRLEFTGQVANLKVNIISLAQLIMQSKCKAILMTHPETGEWASFLEMPGGARIPVSLSGNGMTVLGTNDDEGGVNPVPIDFKTFMGEFYRTHELNKNLSAAATNPDGASYEALMANCGGGVQDDPDTLAKTYDVLMSMKRQLWAEGMAEAAATASESVHATSQPRVRMPQAAFLATTDAVCEKSECSSESLEEAAARLSKSVEADLRKLSELRSKLTAPAPQKPDSTNELSAQTFHDLLHVGDVEKALRTAQESGIQIKSADGGPPRKGGDGASHPIRRKDIENFENCDHCAVTKMTADVVRQNAHVAFAAPPEKSEETLPDLQSCSSSDSEQEPERKSKLSKLAKRLAEMEVREQEMSVLLASSQQQCSSLQNSRSELIQMNQELLELCRE